MYFPIFIMQLTMLMTSVAVVTASSAGNTRSPRSDIPAPRPAMFEFVTDIMQSHPHVRGVAW